MIISVTNRLLCKNDFLQRIEQIAKALPYRIILREKDLQPEKYEQLASECLKICSRYNVPLVINSHIAVAQKLKIPNIHLPMKIFLNHLDELSTFKCIGISVHSVEEAKRSEDLGASYIIVGHIFQTDCKKGVPPIGLDFLKQVCEAVTIPVFAIGGITQLDTTDVLKAGAVGICVMSQLMTCKNPEEVLMSYYNFFGI
ncbi:MAG TPA: thiamine phosphate synthase [Ruminiclostridium sp.]